MTIIKRLPAGGTPEPFLNAIARDIAKWKKRDKAASVEISG
jgi:hypothetical protein